MTSLTVSGIAAAAPAAMPKAADADAMYAELERVWQWPKALSKFLREEEDIWCPEDFVAAFKTDRDWDRFNDREIKDTDNSNRVIGRGMKGRVFRAHEALKEAQEQASKLKHIGEDSKDLDVILDSKDIKEMIARFWHRHKISFPTDEMPGDLLLSRVAREMERRFLHLTDVLKVKGVDVERRAQTKKTDIGKGLTYTAEAKELDASRPETVAAYLAALRMYTLALAIWGAKGRDPAPTDAETRETNPEDYVHFPWQFSLDYVHRADRFVSAALGELSAAEVFRMLKKRDEEERDMWVERIRNTETPTLGQVFKEIYERRQQRWIFDKNRKGPSQSGQGAGGDSALKSW